MAISYPRKSAYPGSRKTIRESLPFTELYENGLMRSTAGKRGSEVNTWSMCYRIIDTNYESADSEEQQALLQRWYEILNLFDNTTCLQIIINNRTPDRDILETTLQMELKEDGYDGYREELNGMMRRKLMHGISHIRTAALKTGQAGGRAKEYISGMGKAASEAETPEEGAGKTAAAFGGQAKKDTEHALSSIKSKRRRHEQETKLRLRRQNGLKLRERKAMAAKPEPMQTNAAARAEAKRAQFICSGRTAAQSGAKTGVKSSRWAGRSTEKMTSWSAKASAKMSAWTAKTTAKVSAKAAEKTAKAAAKASAKAAQASAKAAAYGAKATAAGVKAAVTLLNAVVQALLALLSAGGWVVLAIVLVLLIIWLLVSGISGIGYSTDEQGNAMALPNEVSALTEAYYADAETQLEYFRAAYALEETPPSLVFDGVPAVSDGSEQFYVGNMQDVMAVFYAEIYMGRHGNEPLNLLTESRKARLRQIFSDMNRLSFVLQRVEQVQTETAEGESILQNMVYLKVERISLRAEEAAQRYAFSEEELEVMRQLMSDDGYMLISSAIGTNGDGTFGGQAIKANPNMPSSILGSTIVQNAKRYLGTSYSAMDCSALVRKAYQDTGLSWEGTSTAMARECVNRNCVVEQSQLQPGDLVFWKSDIGGGRCGNSHCGNKCTRWGQIHHVAIYAGDGQIIESASGGVALRGIWESGKWSIAFCARPYVQNGE